MAEGGGEDKASASAPAVFISYASQDAAAAARICSALRQAGIEVWFDQSELRGGDAWDQSIRKQIKTCALFLPIISRNTHDRDEGYFRLEWKLAVDRSHLMTGNKAFLLPVVIDDTRDDDENVPDRFREVQWTRLPAGETPPAFVQRVQRLMSPQPSSTIRPATGAVPSSRALGEPLGASRQSKAALLGVVAVLAAASAYLLVERPWISKHLAGKPVTATASAAAAPANAAPFAPPPHSIAVLPFMNMSGDKDQEYFSEGLTEELLNSLTEITGLQVAGRTSSFSFEGKDSDLGTIARKLNVGAILEGSVRRSGHTVRITAQLINAVTGFHLWSKSYDRDLGDVLKLQTEIATAVAEALKVTLLGNVGAKIEVGGTRNPAAFDAYLRAAKVYRGTLDEQSLRDSITRYSEAIQFDPDYAIAYANRSIARFGLARNWATGESIRDYRESAEADARKAILLAPDLAEGHLALANLLEGTLEFRGANQAYQRALALAPGNAKLLSYYGTFAVQMGQLEVGLEAAHRSVVLDPLNFLNYLSLGISEMYARRYGEALAALKEAKALASDNAGINAWLGYTYYASGDFQSALPACESGDKSNRPICLAIVYNKLERRPEAESLLTKLQADRGDTSAVFYAMIYAQWGKTTRALDWLEIAMRHRDPYLEKLKTNASFDPLRSEPRFQAIERELKFPT
jgi:TolB-like protein/tetratricopeptide (TPR) repeat protein